MGRIPTTVGVVRGEGLIARFGSVVIYLAGESPSTERILGAAETASGAADPGVAIAQRLAATVFSGGSTQPPSFGVVAPTAGGILVLLRGPVRALVEGPEGSRQLSGIRAMTWADEIVRDPVRRLVIAADTHGTTEVPHTNLRSGVVPGGGFILHAPPSGLPSHRSSGNTGSTPRPAPPDSGTPDSTHRAPLPTPSHTRFSNPGAGPDQARRQPGTPSTPTRREQPDVAPDSGSHEVAARAQPATPRTSEPPSGERASEPRGYPVQGGRSAQPGSAPAGSPARGASGSVPRGPAPQRPATSPPENAAKANPEPPETQAVPLGEQPPDPGDPQAAIRTETRVVSRGDIPLVEQAHAAAPVPHIDGLTIPDTSATRGKQQPAGRPQLSKTPRPEPASASASPKETRPDPADQPPTAAFDAEAAAAADRATELAVARNSGVPAETNTGPAPVGALTTADGAVYPLDRPYVIGRDPLIDESVRRAAASPIVIPRDRHVSRVHAYVFLDAGMILVRDAATPGGTFVAAPGAQDWIRVGQRPVELKPGWSLRIGGRILTYRPDPGRR